MGIPEWRRGYIGHGREFPAAGEHRGEKSGRTAAAGDEHRRVLHRTLIVESPVLSLQPVSESVIKRIISFNDIIIFDEQRLRNEDNLR